MTMTSAMAETLDEAYERLHATGPEFDGFLSNHGPMAAEALVRHGHGDLVGSWLDVYMRRLEEFPRGLGPIGSGWQDALGDLRRVADWTALFGREIGEQPWRQVLNTWWPRLLPGVVAAATHGVIRVGHSVRALLADGDDPSHLAELAHGLAYWAARWQTLPGGHAAAAAAAAAGRTHAMTPLESLAAVPRIAEQSGGIRDRLSSLGELAAWPPALAGFSVPSAPEQIRALLAELVDAATVRYLFYGHGNGVMLVHSATAPSAVLRTLPALDTGLWAPSLAAAWAASSALTAVYAPAEPAPRAQLPEPPGGGQSREEIARDTFTRAVEHGDAHVIKFADTAVEVFARTGNPDATAAALRAVQLIQR
jgi:questin oxidase-like protein